MNGISTPPETQVLEKFKKHKRLEKSFGTLIQSEPVFRGVVLF